MVHSAAPLFPKESLRQMDPQIWFGTDFYAGCPLWHNPAIYATFGLLKHNMRLLMELNRGAFTCKVNVLMEWGQLEIGLANERGKNERETFLTCHLMETAIWKLFC